MPRIEYGAGLKQAGLASPCPSQWRKPVKYTILPDLKASEILQAPGCMVFDAIFVDFKNQSGTYYS